MPYKLPLGPIHPAFEEPYKLTLSCKGEIVEDTQVEVGFVMRSIELLTQRRNYIRDLVLVEHVCGICSNVHASTMRWPWKKLARLRSGSCPVYPHHYGELSVCIPIYYGPASALRILAITACSWKSIFFVKSDGYPRSHLWQPGKFRMITLGGVTATSLTSKAFLSWQKRSRRGLKRSLSRSSRRTKRSSPVQKGLVSYPKRMR